MKQKCVLIVVGQSAVLCEATEKPNSNNQYYCGKELRVFPIDQNFINSIKSYLFLHEVDIVNKSSFSFID